MAGNMDKKREKEIKLFQSSVFEDLYFFWRVGTGVRIQDFALARQVLYLLALEPHLQPFCFGYF
jgi:hypothetical protein